MTVCDDAIPADGLRPIIKSQLHATLAMFADAVRQSTDAVWLDDARPSAFWQIAYHTLFYGHMYLHRDWASFRPWPGHRAEVRRPDALRPPRDPDSVLADLPEPYTRDQVLELCAICDAMVDDAIDGFDLTSPDCGFPWYPGVSKLEHQFIAIRHIQHHTAQLADRLRQARDVGVDWIGARPAS